MRLSFFKTCEFDMNDFHFTFRQNTSAVDDNKPSNHSRQLSYWKQNRTGFTNGFTNHYTNEGSSNSSVAGNI